MVKHVPLLVHGTALHLGQSAEDISDRLAQRLSSVDDEDQRAVGGEAPIDEVGQQGLDHRSVLRAPLDHA